jgi:hypothetical protein
MAVCNVRQLNSTAIAARRAARSAAKQATNVVNQQAAKASTQTVSSKSVAVTQQQVAKESPSIKQKLAKTGVLTLFGINTLLAGWGLTALTHVRNTADPALEALAKPVAACVITSAKGHHIDPHTNKPAVSAVKTKVKLGTCPEASAAHSGDVYSKQQESSFISGSEKGGNEGMYEAMNGAIQEARQAQIDSIPGLLLGDVPPLRNVDASGKQADEAFQKLREETKAEQLKPSQPIGSFIEETNQAFGDHLANIPQAVERAVTQLPENTQKVAQVTQQLYKRFFANQGAQHAPNISQQ